jgi:hypothetical protein
MCLETSVQDRGQTEKVKEIEKGGYYKTRTPMHIVLICSETELCGKTCVMNE